MKIFCRDLSGEKDGVPGYIAHPDRKQPGPGILIVHHHYGVTGHLKSVTCEFAKLGYTTVALGIYKLLGEADGVHEAQKKTTDGQFVEVIHRGWRYLTGRNDVDPKRCAVVGYCMGGRIGIHFVAATPDVRGFVGYYPSVRDEGPSPVTTAPSQRRGKRFQMPVLDFLWRQRSCGEHSRAGSSEGKLSC